MKRKAERISYDDSSSDSCSSTSCEQQQQLSTQHRNTSSNTCIRNNRSRRYTDNILPSNYPITHPHPSRNSSSTSTQQYFEQNDSFSFVPTTKVPTNRRHLKLRKQLKTCTNFSSSYFVLDMNAPATNTIGFMGSNRGNDIPVLLNETVSNNTQQQKKNSKQNRFIMHNSAPNSLGLLSNTTKKRNKKCHTTVNTTVSCSPSSTPTIPQNNNTNSQSSSLLQQLPMSNNQQFVQNSTVQLQHNPNTYLNSHQLINNKNNNNTTTVDHQLQQQGAYYYNSNIQSNIMMNQVSNTLLSNQKDSFESFMEWQQPKYQNSNTSLDASPITITPSTPSTNAGEVSPVIGSSSSSLNGYNMSDHNSLTGGNQNYLSQNVQNSYNNTGMNATNGNSYNHESNTFSSQVNVSTPLDVLTQDETRILLNALSYFTSGNYQTF